MTGQELVTALGSYGFSDTSEADKLGALNDTYYDLLSREPWPFLEKTITLTFSGSSAIATNFPTDFRAALSAVDSETGLRLLPYRLDEFRTKYQTHSDETGNPVLYYFVADSLRVWPIPDSDVTVVLDYLHSPVEIDASTEEADIIVPKRFHRVLLFGAVAQLYDMEDDPELAAKAEQRYENRILEMRSELWARQYDRPDTIEVVEPDDYYFHA